MKTRITKSEICWLMFVVLCSINSILYTFYSPYFKTPVDPELQMIIKSILITSGLFNITVTIIKVNFYINQ